MDSGDAVDRLVSGLLAGKTPSLARLISWAENRDRRTERVLGRVFSRTGSAYRVGITGPPGAGKSTLIGRLALRLRDRGDKVAVVAVDPTSPFSGGALLGDRYRMTELSEDPGVFVRSMASRGSMGGLASATEDALDLLDVAGYTYILVETVGVGQVELDVAQMADTVVVVLVPESGDGIQAMKAGLMEIGDIFVVNKADREGAARLKGDLLSVLELAEPRRGWRPPVLETSAVRGDGIEELAGSLDRHRAHLEESGTLDRRRRDTLRLRVLGETREELVRRLEEGSGDLLETLLDKVEERNLSPHEAARRLANGALPRAGEDTPPSTPGESGE